MRYVVVLLALAGAGVAAWVPIGPDGGNVQALGIDPVRPDTLYCTLYTADTLSPVYRTTDAGADWQQVGAVSRAAGIVVDRFNPSVLYCPDGATTIQRSTDAGETWQTTTLTFYASGLACDPFVPGRAYVAGAFYDSFSVPAFGVSTDYGRTWQARAVVDDTGWIQTLDVSPGDSGTVFLGGDYGKVFASTNSGLTWQDRSAGLAADDIVLSVSVNHGNPQIACAGTIYGMFRTTDAGASWHQTGTPRFVMSVDFSPADAAKGYAYGYDTAVVCFATTDAGVNWDPTAPVSPTARLGGLTADPKLGDGAWCPTVSGVMRTTDRGGHWVGMNSGLRSATISTITVPDWSPSRIYLEVEGVGVCQSGNGGSTWERCADFLSCGNICAIGVARGAPGDVLYALEGAG